MGLPFPFVPRRPSGRDTARATGRLGAVLLLAGITACATTPIVEEEPPSEGSQAVKGDQIGALIASSAAAMAPGPAAEMFLGRPVTVLEQVTGAPALIRREGPNEFRRYDLGDCRAYAVIASEAGTVTTLSTGPAVAGDPVPAFTACTAGRGRVGS